MTSIYYYAVSILADIAVNLVNSSNIADYKSIFGTSIPSLVCSVFNRTSKSTLCGKDCDVPQELADFKEKSNKILSSIVIIVVVCIS